LRLLDEKGNLVSPDAFMPHGERYGLMPLIDRWVISNFFKQYHHYYQGNFPITPITYALNISEASINHQWFLEFVKEQLEQVKIPSQTLCFEIRETTAIANFSKVIEFIEELKALGCCFALDNYGHGLDSFEYIKHFPVDYLKIDGSFVKNLLNSEVDQAIVASFHHIGQVMKLKTITQLVENQSTLEKLKALGLDYAQGYAVSTPVPLNFEEINRLTQYS
jgi:EAL domain-containing protein (putative c-di-GMP-specific phosphodiesterase class I)